MHRLERVFGASLLALLFAAPAQAQTLNCDRTFAQKGDAKSTIVQKCGEPVARDSFCLKGEEAQTTELRGPGGTKTIVVEHNACEPVEEWTYRPGSGQFETMLLFRHGALASMRYGSRIP